MPANMSGQESFKREIAVDLLNVKNTKDALLCSSQ
jgi:hypothetical protein